MSESRELLTTEEAASYLTVTASAVRAWRVRGGGPAFIKVGQSVRYSKSALDRWLEAQTVTR